MNLPVANFQCEHVFTQFFSFVQPSEVNEKKKLTDHCTGLGQGMGKRESCPGCRQARGQRIDAGWCTHSIACINSEGGGAILDLSGSLPWVLDNPVQLLSSCQAMLVQTSPQLCYCDQCPQPCQQALFFVGLMNKLDLRTSSRNQTRS